MKLKKKAKKTKSPPKKVKAAARPVGNSMNPTQRIIDALKEHYTFRFNKGNKHMEFCHFSESEYHDLSDTDFNSMKVELNLMNIACSREALRGIIFSNVWPEYDPYVEIIGGLKQWDGHDHIADLAATVTTDEPEYFRWCLKKWMVGFVGSLVDENTVNQLALILCGAQGIGKSTWFGSILLPGLRKYYSSGFMDPKDKETQVQLSELCLFNMDEVENLKPKNVEGIEELITKGSIYLRRAYTTLSQNYIRRCSFCGTANGTNILHDVTGNRRFLCHNVLSIDYELKGINLEQVYAQALHEYREGFRYWLNTEEQAAVEQMNARFRAMNLEEELVTAYLEPCQDGEPGARRMQAHEIQSLLQSKADCGKLSHIAIGKILSAKGFTSKKSNGISKWIVREKQA